MSFATFLSGCSPLSSFEGGQSNDAISEEGQALWTAKAKTDSSKYIYGIEGGGLAEIEEDQVSSGSDVEVYGVNEWWVQIHRLNVFLPRDAVDFEGVDISHDPEPFFSTKVAASPEGCLITTINKWGNFEDISRVFNGQDVGVYAFDGGYAQISPWLHWIPTRCLASIPEEIADAEMKVEVDGFIRQYADAEGNLQGRVICYENQGRIYLGFDGQEYSGPRDGSECAFSETIPRWETAAPSPVWCPTFGECQPATTKETPFINRLELSLLLSWFSLSGQVVQDVEFGPTGGGRIISGFLGATPQQINGAAQSQAIDFMFIFAATAPRIRALKSVAFEAEEGLTGSSASVAAPVATVAAPLLDTIAVVPDNEVIVMAGNSSNPNRFILKPQDRIAIGEVTTPGKSAGIATSFEFEPEINSLLGRAVKPGIAYPVPSWGYQKCGL
ncbi:MAG: hypothetical protein IPJ88_05955 [Myxococcales bacterium]|nr:MAG: hypothetical protein IPJ88_05955 [Myxococcales bacterium]